MFFTLTINYSTQPNLQNFNFAIFTEDVVEKWNKLIIIDIFKPYVGNFVYKAITENPIFACYELIEKNYF